MATYMLTGIQEYQWKRFKAACNIQGITIKQSFLTHVDREVAHFLLHPDKNHGWGLKPKKGGKSK